MSCGSSCSGGGCCGVCKALCAIVVLLLTVTTIAMGIGVWMTIMTPEGLMFGSPNSSIAVIAFVVSIMCWLKLVKKMCGCCKKGMMCKDGSCCPGGGKCPGCGQSPCVCK